MKERWKTIPGYIRYKVSSYGRVVNADREIFLKPIQAKNGYLQVTLFGYGGERKVFHIHRLVAMCFLADYDEKAKVHHISSDRTDNRVTNLRMGHNTGNYSDRLIQIIETGEIFPTKQAVADHIGGDRQYVRHVLQGRRKHHKGYTFRYIYKVGHRNDIGLASPPAESSGETRKRQGPQGRSRNGQDTSSSGLLRSA